MRARAHHQGAVVTCPSATHRVRMSQRVGQGGYLLVEYLIYIAVLAVVMGIAFSAFYRSLDHTRDLVRNSEAILRAVRAGELWRADIRQAIDQPRIVTEEAFTACEIRKADGWVVYVFADDAVWREEAEMPPRQVLPGVRRSSMVQDQRQQVVSWRWELELLTRQKRVRMRPLFTFHAVPEEVRP